MSFSLSELRRSDTLSHARSLFHSFNTMPHQPQTRGERNVLLGLFIASGVVLIILVVFYLLNPRHIIGDQLVNNPNGTPEEIPPQSISPFYVKPITILLVAGVIFSYCFFALSQGLIRKYVPRSVIQLLLVVSVAVLAVGIYEIFFNFSLWSALMASGASPNTLVNTHPNNGVEINLVYATKATLLFTIATFFASMAFKNSLDPINS